MWLHKLEAGKINNYKSIAHLHFISLFLIVYLIVFQLRRLLELAWIRSFLLEMTWI